tara:strand:+ start:275 stop:637 length:363 start_codon:yes stop_codon:yes gene_type:complete
MSFIKGAAAQPAAKPAASAATPLPDAHVKQIVSALAPILQSMVPAPQGHPGAHNVDVLQDPIHMEIEKAKLDAILNPPKDYMIKGKNGNITYINGADKRIQQLSDFQKDRFNSKANGMRV